MSLRKKRMKSALIAIGALVIIAILVWQGITAKGNPDPTAHNLTPLAAMVDTGILVFREGLETVLVLSAIIASLMRSRSNYWRPIATGAGLAYGATLVTWFVVVGIISLVGSTASELDIQAATGLLAIIVLLVVMNWFFHRIYWTGWISFHNRKKQEIIDSIETDETNHSIAYKGLVILGFSSVYREGFEVVLFLQNIRMQVGSKVVLLGSSIGLCLTLIVAVLTFIAHRKLPYRKMLVFTGVMLGAVLLVMVGEQAQEMQLAGWIPTTPLDIHIPAWMGLWFAIFPTVETLASQAIAAVLVLGSYFIAEYIRVWKPRKLAANKRV
jgi:high-affinity iron transporter